MTNINHRKEKSLPPGKAPKGVFNRLYSSPYWLVVILTITVFATECLVMVLLPLFPDLPARVAVLLDSTILILFILPCLNFFLFRPLSHQIMERKRAEEALQREHNRMRDILDAMQDGVCIVNQEHEIEYANSALEREFGPVAGRKCHEYLHGSMEPCPCCKYDEVSAGKSVHWERHSRKTGKTYDLCDTPLHKADGSIAKLQIFRDITERKKAEEELRDSRERLRNLSAHLQAAREEERTAIAREIHDELGQVLAALQMNVSLVADGLRKDQEILTEKVRSMALLIEGGIKTVQRISSELRPVMLDDLGLAEAIEWQARQFEKRSGIPCELAVSLKGKDVDREVSITLFRIFQESLTNVVRHAKARKVEASLMEKRGGMELVVRDDGRGITREQVNSPLAFGLIGMRERAGILGGRVKIVGSMKKGTVVIVRIPVAPKERAHDRHEKDTDRR